MARKVLRDRASRHKVCTNNQVASQEDEIEEIDSLNENEAATEAPRRPIAQEEVQDPSPAARTWSNTVIIRLVQDRLLSIVEISGSVTKFTLR